MLSRRTFLKTTLAANAALLAPASLALSITHISQDQQPVLIFADETSPDSALFAEQFSEQASVVGLDIGQHFDTFNTFCSDHVNGWVSGITRDSDFFVLQQLAAQHRYITAYSATHTSASTQLTHRVSSSTDKAPLLADALANAKKKWPVWLADNLAVLNSQQPASNTALSSTQSATDNQVLVSWLFVPSNPATR
ncbi:MAG: hypothetical protein COB62_03240 [Piscirickettsiaceae bacterium]|nr:MAG: hypothetical protein COB62_03240 [Piscirickettsiaceae bacterium]